MQYCFIHFSVSDSNLPIILPYLNGLSQTLFEYGDSCNISISDKNLMEGDEENGES